MLRFLKCVCVVSLWLAFPWLMFWLWLLGSLTTKPRKR